MAASAHDVAAALRQRVPGIGQKKLHKLLYYCQGHHLATFGEPIFSESISAWKMGPVVSSLWRDERNQEPPPEPHQLGEGALNTIGYVVSLYGALSGDQLERLTHTEPPWRAGNERQAVGDSDRIETGWIRAYFVAAANADQEDDEAGGDREAVAMWLRETRPPTVPPPDKPDTREALLARLIRG